jgi:hypothetical protein
MNRHLPRTSVDGVEPLKDMLARWLASSSAPTIGPTDGTYKGAPWITGKLGGRRFRLNADTTRDGVASALHGRGIWRVVKNRRGNVNLVTPGSTGVVPGWYCYLIDRLEEPSDLGH